MIMFYLVVVFVSVTLGDAANLPQYFSKCKKSDSMLNDCILENVRKGYGYFKEGDNSYHIQSVNPLKVPRLFISVNGGLTINLTDVTLIGLEESIFQEIKMDLDKKRLYIEFDVPTLVSCIAHYDISGRILILPIYGSGPMNVTLVKPHISYVLDYELEMHNNKEYIIPKSNKLIHTTSRVYFELLNLFNGNEQLGTEMLKFLNENWKEVNEEIGTKIGEAIGEVLMQILGRFFRRVPYDEMMNE